MITADNPEVVGPWVAQRTGGVWFPGRGSTIGLTDDAGNLVAGVLCEDFNGANMLFHVAANPGVMRGSEDFIRLCFIYAFEQLKCKRVTGVVASVNKKSIQLAEWLGFKEEARLAGAHPEGDLIVFAMHKEECKWLRRNDEKAV